MAYLAREPYPLVLEDPFNTSRPTQRIAGSRMIAGSLALRLPIRLPGLSRTAQRVLDPLALEAFSGAGLVTPRLFSLDDFVADAGLGARYDLGALAGRWELIAQSDVLRGLHLVAKFPLWASDPERIGPDEEAVGFRWLVGVEAGL